jgi:hypothetical protein
MGYIDLFITDINYNKRIGLRANIFIRYIFSIDDVQKHFYFGLFHKIL